MRFIWSNEIAISFQERTVYNVRDRSDLGDE